MLSGCLFLFFIFFKFFKAGTKSVREQKMVDSLKAQC